VQQGPGKSKGRERFNIEPSNLILREATAVVVEGLVSAPEWNDQRGIVNTFDKKKGRYKLHIKGRKGLLSEKPACCTLECFYLRHAEELRLKRVAVMRAQVAANVRATIAAQDSEPEPEPEPEPAI